MPERTSLGIGRRAGCVDHHGGVIRLNGIAPFLDRVDWCRRGQRLESITAEHPCVRCPPLEAHDGPQGRKRPELK